MILLRIKSMLEEIEQQYVTKSGPAIEPALFLLEGESDIESKTHGRPWPCEREGPARSVGGMKRSGRFLTDICETGGKRSYLRIAS